VLLVAGIKVFQAPLACSTAQLTMTPIIRAYLVAG
jgi:hypothetical protein